MGGIKMNFSEFKRQCYLRAEPSVDLNDVTKDNPINCDKHKLKCSVYDEIIKEFCKTKDEEYACNIWELQSGPKLDDDLNK